MIGYFDADRMRSQPAVRAYAQDCHYSETGRTADCPAACARGSYQLSYWSVRCRRTLCAAAVPSFGKSIAKP